MSPPCHHNHQMISLYFICLASHYRLCYFECRLFKMWRFWEHVLVLLVWCCCITWSSEVHHSFDFCISFLHCRSVVSLMFVLNMCFEVFVNHLLCIFLQNLVTDVNAKCLEYSNWFFTQNVIQRFSGNQNIVNKCMQSTKKL